MKARPDHNKLPRLENQYSQLNIFFTFFSYFAGVNWRKKVTLRSKKRKNAMMLRQFLCVLFYWSAMLASTLPLTLVEEVRGNQVKQQAKTANAAGNKAPKAAGGKIS